MQRTIAVFATAISVTPIAIATVALIAIIAIIAVIVESAIATATVVVVAVIEIASTPSLIVIPGAACVIVGPIPTFKLTRTTPSIIVIVASVFVPGIWLGPVISVHIVIEIATTVEIVAATTDHSPTGIETTSTPAAGVVVIKATISEVISELVIVVVIASAAILVLLHFSEGTPEYFNIPLMATHLKDIILEHYFFQMLTLVDSLFQILTISKIKFLVS